MNNQKQGGPVKAAHADTTESLHSDYNAHLSWTNPLLPAIEAEVIGRYAGQPHNEVFIITADALEFVEPSDRVSDSGCLVAIIDTDTSPELWGWPVYGLPVTLALGPESFGMELRFVNELKLYRPSLITIYLRDRKDWHGPYDHDVALIEGVAA